MAWALSFLVLLGYLSGVISQHTMSQTASVSAPPGQTTKLSCAASGSVSYIVWIQQKPGQAPRFVHCDTCSSKGQGIPNRFTASRSGTTGYLSITGLELEDEADYFCVAWFSSMWIFGGGTELAVLGQPTAPPTVNLYPPSPEELKSSDKATLVCLASGFYPRSIEVDWEADGTPISSGVETTTPTKLDDKYAVSSYLSMNKSDLESTYTCKVKHEGKTFKKEVNLA